MLFSTPESVGAHIDMSDLTRDPGLTVYRPARPNGIAVIMCPGGGYSHQACMHEGHDMAQWFNALGVTYAVLKYRIPEGDFSRPLSDAAQAVRTVRSHAAEWGIDPSKIGIMGASAGGHLASMLSTLFTEKNTKARSINHKNGDVYQWLEDARAMVDEDERMALYQKIDTTMVQDEAAVFPLYQMDHIVVVQDWVKGFEIPWNGWTDTSYYNVSIER